MFRYIKGRLEETEGNFCVVDVHGIGFKINTTIDSQGEAKKNKENAKFYCHLNVKEDAISLFGFTSIFELQVFEKLISISGVGPKTAIGLLNIAGAKELVAAINEEKPELLTKVSGIGKKTAERVVLELKGKIESPASGETVKRMERDGDIEEALISLGYSRVQAKEAIKGVREKTKGFEERFREALRKMTN
ncbi:MAG: Holliday junction branch migration protein RuvA [Candidatus Paceibacterota bacterium]